MKRINYAFMVIGIIALTLTGCGGSSDSTGGGGDTGTSTIKDDKTASIAIATVMGMIGPAMQAVAANPGNAVKADVETGTMYGDQGQCDVTLITDGPNMDFKMECVGYTDSVVVDGDTYTVVVDGIVNQVRTVDGMTSSFEVSTGEGGEGTLALSVNGEDYSTSMNVLTTMTSDPQAQTFTMTTQGHIDELEIDMSCSMDAQSGSFGCA